MYRSKKAAEAGMIEVYYRYWEGNYEDILDWEPGSIS
jgi:hypothetical protein